MKTSILILHGAIGSSRQLRTLADKLTRHYDVHLFDLPGHGGKELPAEPFSISFFANAVLGYIHANKLRDLTIFGFSMGGYIGLQLARRHPGLISRVITLGTKLHWDADTAAKEVRMLDPAVIAVKVPAFAATLAELHAPVDWQDVVRRIADMFLAMGEDDPLMEEHYKEIKCPVLLLVGDRDKTVTLEETITAYRGLPDAQLGILPGTAHPIEQVDVAMLMSMMRHLP